MARRMLDELLANDSFFQQDCECLLDKKTKARLKRENDQTWIALKHRERILRQQALEIQREEESRNGKDGIRRDRGKREDTKDYKFTKWSKLKIRRARREQERWEEHLNRCKRNRFFTPLIKLRTTLSHQEWNRTCHLKERTIIRQNARLHSVMRLRYKYDIDETLSSDNIIFTKLMKRERERRKQAKLRRERMIEIVEKIAREMTNDVRLANKPKDEHSRRMKLRMIRYESLAEISLEGILSTSEGSTFAKAGLAEATKSKENVARIAALERKIKCPGEKSAGDETDVNEKDVEVGKEKATLEEVTRAAEPRRSQSSVEREFPRDNCFFATPNIVTFEDFKPNKVYTRKAIITNKTAKWAYLRFHKVYIEVCQPGVVEIDIMDAAKVKPGLTVPVNVIFSPVKEEEVKAEVSFLTLSADDTKTFHEFRIPVRCTPECAKASLEPRELNFLSAPIWKYDEPKFNEKTLLVTNVGGKSFSIVLEERDGDENCFLWHFDQAEACSTNSSILCTCDSISVDTNREEADENTSDGQVTRKKYQIEVPPKFSCNIRIEFRPKYVGLHHEILEIYFLDNGRLFDKQDVPIWAEVSGYQIHLDPPCIDLGIAMIDSDVCQQSFDIINTGRTTVNVSMKTPKCLGGQVSVHPKSTLVQPETFSKVSVRLIPESSIDRVPKRFYDPVANILEFPVQVQILCQNEDKPPPLTLKALATLTTCHGLVLEPAYVDLGYAYTHESVYTELELTNESLLIQEYAFFDLPLSMEIQPNYGFGSILPGETVKFHLIYSPSLKDIPGSGTGANGMAGERRLYTNYCYAGIKFDRRSIGQRINGSLTFVSFFIRVATLAELAGSEKPSIIGRLKNQWGTLSKIPNSRGSPPPVPIEFKISRKVTERGNGTAEGETDSPSNELFDDSVDSQVCPSGEIVRMPSEEIGQPDRRKDKSCIEVCVYIMDTFCELSEQIVQFPATPCGSYSKATVYLRGYNMASYPNCTCGIAKNQKKEFTARYEFHSSSDRVKIMPPSGSLRSDEFTDVRFVFEPRLPRKMIFEEGLRLRVNVEEQDTKREKVGRKAEARKATTQGTAQSKKDISDADKFAGENSLLEIFDSCVSTIFVTCEIDIETKAGEKHDEVLFAKLICPVTKPEIIVLNENREISFGRSAIGAPSRRFLLVKNISNRTVDVETSLMDPFGSFFVPPGRTIETGSILKLPVTYRPNQSNEEDQEYFEVFCARSNTRWSVKVSGRGVVPSYVLKPRFRVARLEVTGKKPVEVGMSMQNTGTCPVIFRLCIIDVLEGNIPRDEEESIEKTAKKKKKGKVDTENSAKSPIKVDFDDKLRPHEELAIFGGNLQRSADHSCFSFTNLDEDKQLTVPEKRKVDFGVQFQPRDVEDVSDRRRDTVETSPEGMEKSKEAEKLDKTKKSNYCHVAIIKLMLGRTTVQSFVIICSTTWKVANLRSDASQLR